MTESDRLSRLFALQEALQTRLYVSSTAVVRNVPYVKDMILALTDELHEALREVPWKPWKTQQAWHDQEFKEELVDAWHFLINLTLASGMNSDELFTRFTAKNATNHVRQDERY